MSVRHTVGIAVAVLVLALPWPRGSAARPAAQTTVIDLDFSRVLTWRPIGPPIGGRVVAIDGAESPIGTFYAGTAGGGLWRTTDFGASWTAVFDAPPIGAVSAVAVSPSRSDTIYTATASGDDGGRGGALYKSSDRGATWRSIGLRTRGRVVDVTIARGTPDRVFVAVSAETAASRGVFRSSDGGNTFERVLDVPGLDTSVTAHDQRTDVIFVTNASSDGDTAGLFRSLDGGDTWQSTAPADARLGSGPVTLSLAVAPTSGDVLLLVARADSATLWRSTDIGETWTRAGALTDVPSDARPQMRVAASGAIHVVAGRLWVSRDDGATFSLAPGVAPERDDRLIWLHPGDDNVALLAGGAGAIVTVNGGATWSADALPAASAVDRLSIDTSFPYRICAAAASHVMCAPHRTDRGDPAAGDWQPLPVSLAGTAVPDPTDPDIVFGGDLVRYDRRIGQAFDIATPDAGDASTAAATLAFSPDGRTLYAGSRGVWRTTNSGAAWTAVSGDLTTGGAARVSALTVSPVDPRVIWTGLDDGRLHVTRDAGATWTEVQPPAGASARAIRAIEPSRFDPRSAYAVVACTAATPCLLRTRDGGETWIDIGADLSDGGRLHVVREDAFRRGLLFAGADRGVFISFDDGDRWQPLQLNLPATAVRDLLIKDADVVAATAGRGVWVLQDISPLRQLTADVRRADAFLFRPAQAWRTRATDSTPGASPAGSETWLTYLLGDDVNGDIAIDIIESATGDVLRRFASRPDPDLGQLSLPTGPGLHRVSWDLRYRNPVPGRSDGVPGTRVVPGVYQVRLTIGGRVMRQALSVRMDPRVRAPAADLSAQRDLGRAIDAARAAVHATIADRADANASSLAAAGADLDHIAALLQRADARPSPRIERLAAEAIERATAAIDSDARSARRVFGLAFDQAR